MIKIMFWCPVFYPQESGYSHAFQNLVSAILDYISDVAITVVTPYELGRYDELKKDRLKVVRLESKSSIRKIGRFINEYFYAREVSRRFKLDNYDLLFVETLENPIFVNLLDNDVCEKTIVRIHATAETEYVVFGKTIRSKIMRRLIRRAICKKISVITSTNKFHINFIKKYYLDENAIEIGNKVFFYYP